MTRFIRSKTMVRNPDATMVHEHVATPARIPFDPAASNIFLVGLRGSGKTTLGRMLAERLGAVFTDTDALVAGRAGKSIAAIVADRGWEAFRILEKEVLREACSRRGQVVATGGGIVLDPANRDLLEQSGMVIYLMADIATLAFRLAENPLAEQRPALSHRDAKVELAQSMQERAPLYMCLADHVLRVDNDPESLVRELLQKITRHHGETSENMGAGRHANPLGTNRDGKASR